MGKLWESYGEFKYVDNKKCFDGYRIDCDGEGQRKMSDLLGQSDMYSEACSSKLDWVKLRFGFKHKIAVTDDNIDEFLAEYKQKVDDVEFDSIKYKLKKDGNKKYVESSSFLDKDGNEIDDEFLNQLAGDIAMIALSSEVWYEYITGEYGIPQKVYYNEKVYEYKTNKLLVKSQIESFKQKIYDPYAKYSGYTYRLISLETRVKEYKLKVDLQEYENPFWFANMENLYLSVDAAKAMKPKDFVELVQSSIEFDYKKHSKGFFADFASFFVAVAFAYFGRPDLAAAIMVSDVTSKMDNKAIQIVGQALSFYVGGGLKGNSLTSLSANEAISLIANISELYFILKYNPPKSDIDDQESETTQKMFYEMPYDVYDDIYCYDELIKVDI